MVFRAWCAAVYNEPGRIAGVQGVATEISEQAQVERTLSESAARWRSLVENAPEFIFTVDRQGRLLFVNHAMAGARLEDVIGADIFRFAPREDTPRLREVLERVFTTGETASYEGRWHGGDGQLRWLESHYGPLRQNGVVTAVIGLALDVSQRKEAEEKLRLARQELEERVRQRTDDLDRSNDALRQEICQRADAERELRAQKNLIELVLQGMTSGVIVADEAGRAIIVNPAIGQIFGIDAERLRGCDWRQLAGIFSTDKRQPLPPDQWPQSHVSNGETVDGIEMYVRPPGAAGGRWLIASGSPLRDEDGTLRGGMVVFRDETERKLAEERFGLMVQGSKEGLWDTEVVADDPFNPQNPIYYSPRLKEWLGYSDDEFPPILQSWADCVWPEDRERVYGALSKHLFQHEPFDEEYRAQTRSGEVRWFSARGQAIWDRTGRPVRMSGSFMDITSRKRAEEALRESELRFRRLVETANVVPWEMDFTAGLLTYVGPQAALLLGFPVEAWYAPNFWVDRLHPADRDWVLTVCRDALRSDSPPSSDLEYRMVAADGSVVWVRDIASRISRAEGPPLLSGFMFNITDRRTAERARQESEARLQSILDSTPSVIYLKDVQGRYILVNKAHERLLGRPREELAGKTVHDVYPPEVADRLAANDRQVLQSDEALQFEELVITRQYGLRSYLTVKFPLRDHDAVVRGVCGISTDITERKQAEERLLQEQDFLRGLLKVHERDRQLMAYEIHDGLVQDMTAGLWHLESLSQAIRNLNPQDADTLQLAVGLLRRSISEARRLLSGLRPPILDEAGVVLAIQYLVAEQSVPGKLDIHFSHDVHFDRLDSLLEGTLFRIVQESLNNIMRHSRAALGEVRLTQTGDHVQLLVRDFGCGFRLEDVPTDRFGLQGIRKRAALVGGHAEIDTAPGRGTRIVVDLPLTLAADGAPP